MKQADLPSVSIVIETSTWNERGGFNLPTLLKSLRQQDYPSETLEVVVPIVAEVEHKWSAVSEEFPEVEAVKLGSGLNYYQIKQAGVEHSKGEFVAMVDADNSVAPDWARQLVEPMLSNPRVLAVQGRSRFRLARLSRMWDAVWWIGAFSPKGPIDRIFSSNNLAFRGDFLRRNFYPDHRVTRGVWTRKMTQRIQEAGGVIWLNPSAIWLHDFDPGLRQALRRALSRGADMIHARLHAPKPSEMVQRRLIFLFPWLGLPFLMLKDGWRVISTSRQVGLGSWQLWRVPLYVVAVVALDVVAFVGMLQAAYGGREIPPP